MESSGKTTLILSREPDSILKADLMQSRVMTVPVKLDHSSPQPKRSVVSPSALHNTDCMNGSIA